MNTRPVFQSDKRMLEAAIGLAVEKHAGQTDRGGAPYILHCLRVMFQQTTYRAMVVGVLHDVIEDTTTTADDLLERGYPLDVVQDLLALTKLPNESRLNAAERAGARPISRAVKLADVNENLDLTRLKHVREKDLQRHAEYLKVKERLLSFQP